MKQYIAEHDGEKPNDEEVIDFAEQFQYDKELEDELVGDEYEIYAGDDEDSDAGDYGVIEGKR